MMEAKDTERIEATKNCLAKWFDKGRSYGNTPITKDMLAELEADGEAQAEISFKAGYYEGRGLGIRDGMREVVEFVRQCCYIIHGSRDDEEAWQAKLKEWEVEPK